MSILSTRESLFWQHVEDEDYDGAAQHTLTASELLQESANTYLDQAIADGEVSVSRIFLSHKLGKFVGYTTVETKSGVKIRRSSDGGLGISADYDETNGENPNGTYQDLTVEIDLPAGGGATVHEERREVKDFTHTGSGGKRTLSKPGSERVMGDVTRMIWQVYE